MRLLEVLIPTYGRPESAALAIESVLACDDDRISVRCNSNGYEPLLEKYRDYDERVIYDCFPENRGVHANLLHLYRATDAKFCMLLSDEDRLSSAGAKSFLDYIEGLGDDVVVVSSSIYDLAENQYYFVPNKRLVSARMSINQFLMLAPIPTYFSGLLFRASRLRLLDLDSLLKPSLGNAYPHLDISLTLLINGFLSFYQPYFVEKDEEVKFGGDGYSHIKSDKKSIKNIDDNPKLNINIYGPAARARQFFYREKLLSKYKSDLNFMGVFFRKLELLSTALGHMLSSPRVVNLPKDFNFSNELDFAYVNAERDGELSRSIFTSVFKFVVKLPAPATLLLRKLMSLFLRYFRAIYIRIEFNA